MTATDWNRVTLMCYYHMCDRCTYLATCECHCHKEDTTNDIPQRME